MWLLDRIDCWLNGRDIDEIEDELLVVDTANAHDDDAYASAAEASANEGEARRLVAQAKAHAREIDIAESDSDDWGPPGWKPPARRDRATVAEGADDQALPADENQLEEPQ